MATTRLSNVIVFDGAGGSFPSSVEIKSVLFVPGSGSPTATITASGGVVWEAAATRIFDDVCIKDAQGITVALAGTGTKLYVYLR